MKYWYPYFFQYIAGGLFFLLGLLLAFHAGDMKAQPKESKKFLWILIVGFFIYALGHGAWIYLASHT